jgi:hypothetical protein
MLRPKRAGGLAAGAGGVPGLIEDSEWGEIVAARSTAGRLGGVAA